MRADDIQSNAVTYAVMTPNRVLPDTDEFDTGITHPFIGLGINPPTPANAVINSEQEWNNWETWRLTVNQLEDLPAIDGLPALGLDFFSLVPTSIQEDIENNLYSRDDLINYSASLLAESETLSFSPSLFISNTPIWQDGVVQNDIFWGNKLDSRTIGQISSRQIGILNFNPTQISPSKVGIGQVGEFQVGTFQISPPQISPTQIGFSQIATNQISPTEIGFNQLAIAQVATSQISPSQISISQNNSPKAILPSFDSSEEFINWNNLIGVISDTAIGHSSITEEGFFVLVPSNASQISPSEVSISQIGTSENDLTEISPSEANSSQIGQHEIGFTQVSPTKVSSSKIYPPQTTLAQVSVTEVDSTKINLSEISSFEKDSAKLSFTSSISSNQFSHFHNSTSQIINNVNNTATNIWSDLLQPSTQLDIDFQITDLPSGQLAEATITGFYDSGVPNAGTIEIDHDANGVGWFIDSTPLDNSEFIAQDTDSYLLAAAESEANGKYDLLTTVLHELAHLYGFIDGYAGFDANVETENGTTKFIGDDFEAILDGEHLDKEAHPHDLMNTHLAPGVRKLPSELNVEILQAILSEDAEIPLNPPYQGGLDASLGKGGAEGGGIELPTASLTSDPLLAISNGDFEISDTTTDSFAWDTRGASGIENGQAVLTEDSPFLSNFSQTFTVPEEVKTLQFKLVETELGDGETGGLGDKENINPPDAFEVALLDANSNQSLVSDNDLTPTDSLLNIQNDGTAYFSDKVRIGGAASGDIIDLDKSRTVTVDISHLAAGTEATLYFDLLGFGDVDSRVVIDDVRLSDQNLLTPLAVGDTATTTQGQPVTINILANDTDDDGEIATNSVQIQTEPSNGFAIPRDDGMVSYIPDTGFAGTDSFTYVVQDNDGQFSEPATVEVTVDNIAPEIAEIQIPNNITEGVEFTLNAVATDAGNDQLTYSWQFDDGTTAEGQTVARTYPDNDTYSGSVTVTDLYGGSDTQTFEVKVNNATPIVNAGVDVTIDEGSSVELSGSYSDTGANDTHTITWDFGDGSTADTSEASHVYTDDGEYTATYTVTDNDGAVGSDTVEVTVNNVAPIIESLTGDTVINEGDTANFNAIASDPGDDTITYIWDFGDNTPPVEGASPSHVFTDDGTYTVTLTVQDEDGGVTNQTLNVTVANVAPSLSEINGKTTVDEGEVVNYSASAKDPGDDELTYTWNFGDSTPTESGTNATHAFANNGDYEINLSVQDEDGGEALQTLDVTVNNVAPSIDTNNTKTGFEGSSVEFVATISDPGTDDLTITWDFGDDSEVVTSNYNESPTIHNTTQTHTYSQDGTYIAKVTVTDSDGAVTESTIDVTIDNIAPVIESITDDTEINEGDTVALNATAIDAGNDELTYTWNLGNSTELTGQSVEAVYADNGVYEVTLTVADTEGDSTSSNLTITVNNVAPTIEPIDNLTSDEGESVEFNFNFNDPGILDTHTIEWNFGDNSDPAIVTDNQTAIAHTYADNGDYEAVLTITDNDGAITTTNVLVAIANIPPAVAEINGATNVNEGETVNYSAAATDPGDDELTYTWNFGDGLPSNGGTEELSTTDDQPVSHSYAQDGDYQINLSVADEDGGETIRILDVTVNNVAPTLSIAETQTGNEGEAVEFAASFNDPGNDDLTITWDFGDGSDVISTNYSAESTPNTETQSHTYSQDGTYTATVTVTDSDGAITESTIDVTINNTAPVIESLIGDAEINEGDTAQFNATASDAGNDELTYTWDLGNGAEIIGQSVEAVYLDNGIYEVTLTVTDTEGDSISSNLTITVNNVAPVIELIDDIAGNEGESVEFNFNFSDVGILDTHTVTWDFGDETEPVTIESDRSAIAHTYADNGDYEAVLTVTDNDGAITSINISVAITNVAPVIESLTGDTAINEGDTANFSAIASDPGDDELTYTWNYGDGETGTGAGNSHTYIDNGDYTVTLTVDDGDGGITTENLTIVVNNVAPVIDSIEDKTSNEGQEVQFKLNFSDAGILDTHTVEWDFGDGSELLEIDGDTSTVSHVYADNGIYTATITITDKDGATASQDIRVTVNNLAPVIESLIGDTAINEGDTATFSAIATDAGNDELTYTWDFGDGETGTGADISHTFTSNGDYPVTLIVRDSDGASTSQTLDVTVSNVAPVIESLTGDTEINEGDTASFSAIASDAGNDELTYTWDFGDGTEQLSVSEADLPTEHTYADNGDYIVTLTVTDSEGASTSSTHELTVNNTVPVITELTDDLTINEGDAASLKVTATDAGDDELTYAWDFGDGTNTVMGENVEHIFADNGLYEATVTVTDDDGSSTTQSLTITVNNVAPIIDPWSDETATEGDLVEFNATFSDPGVLDTHTIEWDFGDGSTANDTLTPVHIYPDNGIYDVTLTITDKDAASSTNTMTVTVNNAAPAIASLTGDTNVNEGDTANFSLTATDPGNDELNYTWDFGDGEVATGKDVSHTFANNGSYTITATVTDDDGAATSSTIEVTVNNVAPVIDSLTGDTNINEGDTAQFKASATDPGDDTLTYTWNLSDGTELTGEEITHTFTEDGEYDVNLTVADEDGGITTQTLTVTVSNVAPLVDAGENRVSNEGDIVEFNASFSDPGIEDTHTIKWNFGDGSTATNTLTPSHTYTDNGIYDVSITVTDDEGASTTSTLKVTVNNVAPVIDELEDKTGNEGEAIAFNANFNDPGILDTHTIEWDFGDGSTATNTLTPSHTYPDNGEYQVTLAVTDDDGAATSSTIKVTVNNVAPAIDSLTGDTEISEGDSANFNAIASDAGNDELTYTWNFGDNSETVTEQNILKDTASHIIHTFDEDGEYTVELIVTDSDGATAVQTLTITVNNLAPAIEPIEDTVSNEGEGVEFNATFSDPGILDTHTIEWDFGDGNSQSTVNSDAEQSGANPLGQQSTVSHTYSDNGEYDVNLTITDDEGASTTQSFKVTVNNVPPTIIDIHTDSTIADGVVTNFSATAFDPGSDTLTYAWDLGDGNKLKGKDINHAYDYAGNYTITLTVTDDDNAEVTETRDIYVEPTVKSNLKFLQNRLTSKILVDGEVVEEIQGRQNQPISTDFERINISAIDSPDVPNALADRTNLDNGEGIGITDGSDYNTSLKKRIDKDESLLIAIAPTDSYNSAVTATFTVDRLQAISNNTNGGVVKVVALLEGEIVGEQSFNLNNYRDNFTFTNDVPFNSLQLIAGEDTKFTFLEVDLETTRYLLPIKNNLRLEQNGLNLAVLEDGVEIEAIATEPNQPFVDSFERLNINAVDGNVDSQLLVDESGFGVVNNFVNGDEALTISIQPTSNYNAAQDITIEFIEANISGEVELTFLRGDLVVGESEAIIETAVGKITNHSNLAFDTVRIKSGSPNTNFSIKAVEFTTINADNRHTELTFYQDQLQSKIFEDGYLVEEYSGGQNQPLTGDTSRLTINAVDSSDNSNFVDSILLDRGEGIGIRDGNDYNSSKKKRIDGDEILEVTINPTINYNSATRAIVTVDKIKSGNSNGGVVKLTAYWQGELVAEESFDITSEKETITLDSNIAFDKLAVSAGDNNMSFTFRVAQFTTAATWVEELEVDEGEKINFSAPSDIDAEEFNWNFGDGTTKSGKQVTHRFTDNGEYIVTLTAADNPAIERTMTITVNNIAPTITEINGDRIINLGDIASFRAIATDPGNDELTYTWDLGDGLQLTGEVIDYNFSNPGTYTVAVTVADDDGGFDTQTMPVIVKDSDNFFNLKAEGKVRINGKSDLEADILNINDDTHIYGGEGFTINGNQTLPVQRDANGNPVRVNGKSLLVDGAITVGSGYTESNAAAAKNKYEGLIPPQVIAPLNVFVPEHAALIDIELGQRIAPGTKYIEFNPQQNPLNNQSDWDNKFPAPGTPDAPTVVVISNGGLNIPSGVDISNYVIIVEQGNLNFNGSGHILDNVALIAQNSSINLASVQSNNLAVLAANTININGGARFAGDTLIAMGDRNGSLHFDGATSTLDSASNLEVISQGNIIFNSSSTTKGEFIAAKNFTANGRANLIGSIQVKGDITIHGGIDLVNDQ